MAPISQKWMNLILFIYFLLGAFALIAQTIILREFYVVVYGNEFIFGVLICNWLLGVFLGAMMGGFISQRCMNHLRLFLILILGISIVFPITITLIRFSFIITGTPPGNYIGFFKVIIYSAMFIIPIGFFIGFAFPIAARLQSQYFTENVINDLENEIHPHKINAISNIYIYEGFGALLGGFVYTFILVERFNSYQISSILALLLLGSTALVLYKVKYKRIQILVCSVLIIHLVLLLPIINEKINDFMVKKRWSSMTSLELLYSIDSKYQNIAIGSFFNQYHLYLNNKLSSVFPNDEDNRLLAIHLICQHPKPERILIIGEAISGLAKALFSYNVRELISIEIDKRAEEAILNYLPQSDIEILNKKNFKRVNQDGRAYIKDLVNGNIEKEKKKNQINKKCFDLVYLNISEPSTLLINRYYTYEFFKDLSRIVNKKGVIAFHVTSSENYEKGIVEDYTASLYHTVRAIFKEVVVAPGHQNLFFASLRKGIILDQPEKLIKRFKEKNLHPQKLGMIFYSLYPEEKTKFIKRSLINSRGTKINTDKIPIASLYFNKIIGWYGKSNLSAILNHLEKIQLSDLILFVLSLFTFRLLYLFFSRRKNGIFPKSLKAHTLLVVFSSGLAGLSLELVILYIFQIHFGNIYHLVGFIIAIFMFGLPLGAILSKKMILSHQFSQRGLIIFVVLMQVVLALISLFLPHLSQIFKVYYFVHQILICTETILIGFIVGFVFPISLHLYMGKSGQEGRTAGIVDAFDHLGAAVGALFLGTLLLPAIGIVNICILVAILLSISAFFLYLEKKPIRPNR